MATVLLKAFSFTLIILIGILLRSYKVVNPQAGDAVKKILLYVTLPAAVIANFSGIERMDLGLILIALLGMAANLIMIFVGFLITRGREKGVRALHMFCLPAFNIGAFCLPFVQSFLPALGSVTACMFDVGNSMMCTGGTYAFVSACFSEDKEKGRILSFCKKLLSSPPLVTYVIMVTLSAVRISLPSSVLLLIDPIAKANPFVAMLMLGLLFRLELKKEYLLSVVRILGLRHIFAALLAAFCYFLLPFDLIVRQTLVLVSFAPLSAVSSAYTGMCGGDEGMASCINSISIFCSLVGITVLLGVMGLK